MYRVGSWTCLYIVGGAQNVCTHRVGGALFCCTPIYTARSSIFHEHIGEEA